MRVLATTALAALLLAARADRYHPRAPPAPAPARAPPHERTASYWTEQAQATLRARLAAQGGPAGEGYAKNVVMFLGDGMSIPTLAAARTLLGQRNNRLGEETSLFFENFPTTGLVKTYCVDAQIADSACSGTAYLCGVKANQGTLGLSGAVPRGNCSASLQPAARLRSIAAWALADGRAAGLVSTARVTHASPAAAYARAADRTWEHDAAVRADGADPALCPDIASQLVHHFPGKDFKVILGGGRRGFLDSSIKDEEGKRGRREDGRNLIEEWQSDKRARNASHRYVWNRRQLAEVSREPPEYLLGLFESSHMQYHLEADSDTEPTLSEMTEAAIRVLSRNERGFFLFVEGGRIDHAHHGNYAALALDETIELSRAVERAAALLPAAGSLLLVTADHSHVLAHAGYSPRGAPVLGLSAQRDRDLVPYMTLSYVNGPGRRHEVDQKRPSPSEEPQFGSARWRSHVDVPLSSETHGGDDVAVFARGPHHRVFSGLYEQSALPHLMGYAACLGPGLHACTAH